MPPASYFSVSLGRVALLALIAGSVFFVELGSARLWDRDEPRNARASHEMLERGDWIVPTFNGELRDHKPILLYWGQMSSYLAIGESEFAARLPSALCALLTIAAVALLASRLSGKSRGLSQEGFWAAGCLATCGLFVMAGRAATPDACLIAFSTLGIASLVIASLAGSPPYTSGRVASARWLPAMFGYTMLGLAVLAKGPVGIVLPLIVVHAWWLICYRLQSRQQLNHSGEKQDQVAESKWLTSSVGELWATFHPGRCLRAVLALRTIPGVLLSLLAAAPWYIAVGLETNGAFLRGFFLDHNVGRALGSMEGHQGSIFFYPIAFLVGMFPWSMWLIPVMLWSWKACRENILQRQMIVLATVWVSVYVLAFSAASTKLPSYITPCYAGAALVLGSFWRQFETAWSRPSITVRRIAYGLTAIVGTGIAIGIVVLSRQEAMPLLAGASLAGVVIALLGLVGLANDLFSVADRSARQIPSQLGLMRQTFRLLAKTERIPMVWLGAAAAFQVILFGFGSKSVDAYRSDLLTLTAVQHADEAQAASQTPWLAIGGMEPSWVHYLGCEITEVTEPESDPATWQIVAKFLQEHPAGRVIVVGEAAYEAMQLWQQGAPALEQPIGPLQELAIAPRFLRPGNLRVMQQSQEVVRMARGARIGEQR